MTWQPIETAPVDGTEILLLIDGKVIEGHWLEIEDPHYGSFGSWELVVLPFHGCGCCASDDPPEPTHWMPLPEPPEEE